MYAMVGELGLRSCRCWNLGWGPFLSTVGARAGPGAQLPSWVCPPSLFFSLRCRRLQAAGELSQDSAAVRSAGALLLRDLAHSPERRVYLARPRVCHRRRVARGAGGQWGRGAGGADGRRRWGERARE